MASTVTQGETFVLDEAGFAALIAVLKKEGYQTLGPRARNGSIVYEPIDSPADLPIGLADDQDGGRYRLTPGMPNAYFDYTVGHASWKSYLFPSREKLWSADRVDQRAHPDQKGYGFQITEEAAEVPAYAFIGVRSCDLAAIKIQDKVFGHGAESDPRYRARREKAFIVAVNCGRAGKTCFCVSMNTGPKAGEGFDLALTELCGDDCHYFIVESGSLRGTAILTQLPLTAAGAAGDEAALAVIARARGQMGRTMLPEAADVLRNNPEHPHWDEVASRCMGCANCTMVCPTCFCHTVEDTTDLSGDHTERWRTWDSCFSIDYSYIHGGSMRREGSARYRQWATHKLSNWHEQFGSSGCTGCGRCIAWCPVGIDITKEVAALAHKAEGGNGEDGV